VFVSHSPQLERRDLIATIVGLPVPGGSPVCISSANTLRRRDVS